MQIRILHNNLIGRISRIYVLNQVLSYVLSQLLSCVLSILLNHVLSQFVTFLLI